MPAPFVRLGRIVRSHGTSGELSVTLEPGVLPDELPGITTWVVPPPESGALARVVAGVRPGPKGTLIKMQGLATPEAARELAGRWLLARADAVSAPTPPDVDLTGYTAVSHDRGELGRVADLIVTGANDVLVVEGGPFGRVLIPVIDDVVVGVDHAERTVSVMLLEGLIDEASS